MTLGLDLDMNKDFEENSPHQEGIILETYQRPNKSQLLEPPDLTNTNIYGTEIFVITNRCGQNF